MDELVPIAVVGSLVLGTVTVVRYLSDAYTRRLLVQRGLYDDRLARLFAVEARLRTLGALKWGFVLAGVGVALVLIETLGGEREPILAAGLLALGGAAGFFGYYAFARRDDGLEAALRQAAAPGPADAPLTGAGPTVA